MTKKFRAFLIRNGTIEQIEMAKKIRAKKIEEYFSYRCKGCKKVFHNEEPFIYDEYPSCEYDEEKNLMVGEIFCSRECHKKLFEENFYGKYDEEI